MSLRFPENVVIKLSVLITLNFFGFQSTYSFRPKIQTLKKSSEFSYNFNFDEDEGFTLRSNGCSIPRMDTSEFSAKMLVQNPTKVAFCPNNRHPLLSSNQTHIWTTKKHFKYYKINQKSRFYCCYKSFHRSIPLVKLLHTAYQVNYLDCIKFKESIEAANEFVKVLCYHKDKKIYEDFFTFVPKKHFTATREHPFDIKHEPAFNVIIMGLSSMSRLNFHRTLPKTFNLLQELGAVELFGYHAIEDDTFKNIIPILTGMKRDEFNATCWPGYRPIFGNYPFIWERFKDMGFYTALVEDSVKSGLSNCGMFVGNPTDYYLHPFILESKKVTAPKKQRRKVLKLFSKMCMGHKYYYSIILEYARQLTEVLKSSKLFGFIWESSMSHYNLSTPTVMDHGYEKFIKELNRTGYLNDTILILLSDHGMKYGSTQGTKQGRLEQRLPLATILVPPDFRKLYGLAYGNLMTNSKRLTTAVDLHETLIDLIDLNAVKNTEIYDRSHTKSINKRGISLFLPIPSNRTCESAGIPNHWCTCHKVIKLNLKNKIVIAATDYIVGHLNYLLMNYSQCARLKLEKIIEFEEMRPHYGKETDWREYRAVVILRPALVKYEAILRHDRGAWSALAPIRRLDNYVDQNRCLHDEILKYYCQCE